MYTRIVEITLKPGKLNEARDMMNREVAPVLRTQTGFVDSIALVSDTDQNTIVSITMWHTKAEAERYNNAQFPRLIEMIEPMMTRYNVKTFTVESSTFHKIAAGKAA